MVSKNTIITRLQKHAGKWFTDLPELKGSILCAHYFSLPNHSGGVAEPAERFVTQNGGVITFNEVPVYKFVNAIEREIGKRIPNDRRTEIYHKVLKGAPGYKEVPGWDSPSKESIYAEPLTPFSIPRDDTISNQDLLDALAPAAEITLGKAESIGITVAWWDASSNAKFSAMMSFGSGVRGGRLGNDHRHTVSDVPRNYFRDRLMDYIAEHLDGQEELKQAARKAICPDLTDGEIEEYTRLIAEDRKQMDEKAGAGVSGERPPLTREERARRIMKNDSEIRTLAQAMKIVLINEAIRSIDDSINCQTPKPMRIRRRPGTEVTGSVVLPHYARTRNEDIVPDDEVDRDCDQVRAMIKKFVTWGSWDIDSFRIALAHNMTRDKFLTFLNKRGSDDAQKMSAAYLLSWEFFNRRQKLGLSMEDGYPREELDILYKRRKDAKRTARELALVEAYRQKKKDLEEKTSNEIRALGKIHEQKSDDQHKRHFEELKALVQAHPVGSPSYSEKVRELAEKQRKESDAQIQEHEKEKRAQGSSHCKEFDAFREERKKQKEALREEERLEALRKEEQAQPLAEARPAKLNTRKRVSGGASGGRGKRARK
ncbi:hypothetical protein V8F06_010863 [Rhypophila decipiens]